jgi:TonB-dependent receptor
MSSGKLAHRPTPVSVSLLAAAIAGALAVLAASPAYAQAVPEPQDTEQPQPAAQASEPAADEEATELDAVVVTGLRSSLQSAQAIKQNSEQIVDSIVAEDIGKLPDITASASLARVPGVQVTRASGEAADVQVRGLPNLTTTYNGRELFTAENRSVALQDFPAGGVAALDVYKSSTAELVEPGIAGLINVRSRRPFDFDGFEISGSANMIYADQADTPDVNGNFLISNRWQTGIGEMGLLVNGAWNEIRFLDSTREESLVMGVAQPGQTDQPGFRFPDAVATYYGSGRRTRPSLNAAFQWKPNERWEINADMLFQGFRSRDANSFMFVPLFTGDTQFSDVVTEPGASGDQAQSFTATGGLRPDGFESAVDARTNTYQVGLGAVYRNGGVRWSGDIAATDSTFELHEANIDFAFASTPVRDVQFDAPGGDGGPTFSFRDFDLRDPNNFVFRGLFDRNYRAEGSDVQARTDFEFAPESGFITAYQAGLRATDRDASRRAGQRYAFWEPNGLRYTDLPVALAYTGGGFEGDDHAPPRYWIAPNRNSIRWNLDELRAIVGFPAGDPEFADADTFEANERAYTAYGQIKYAFDAGSVPIDGSIGVRAVQTETEITGIGGTGQQTDSNRYTDILPNASARFRFGEKFQIRVAATETRTRPNFDQLNPATFIGTPPVICFSDPDDPNCFLSGSGGNPDLDPLESRNYDLTFEYYFAPTGSATLSLFRRDVKGFISQTTADIPDPDYNFVRLTRPENGGEGRMQGAEFAFQTFLDYDFAPEWARAFGVQANYTYIDAGAELGPFQASSLPGKPRVPGVSKNAYNLVLMYEQPIFSARLAYNWRSKWVQEYSQIFDPGIGAVGPTLPLVQDERGTLDFSMNYTPVENLTFAFDVNNILGDPITNSRQYNVHGDEYPRQVKYLETVYSLGVRFRF